MKGLLTVAALAASLVAAAPAAAQTYNFADFGNSVFQYGYGYTGFTFTPLTQSSNSCFGQAGFSCVQAPGSDVPVIGVNTNATTLSFSTVDIPTNTLLFHPDANPNGTGDAILQFVAPTTGRYTFDGVFSRLDRVADGGNGVVAIAGAFNRIYEVTLPNGPQGSSVGFNQTLLMNAGQSLFIGVNNRGEYTFDSTGLSGNITFAAVPEPAAWAMMIGGFGMVGGTLRRRKVSARIAFA